MCHRRCRVTPGFQSPGERGLILDAGHPSTGSESSLRVFLDGRSLPAWTSRGLLRPLSDPERDASLARRRGSLLSDRSVVGQPAAQWAPLGFKCMFLLRLAVSTGPCL